MTVIGQISRAFGYGPWDRTLIQGRIIPKTQETVFDTSVFHTPPYKVRIKGKVGQSSEKISVPPHLGVVANEKGAFGSPSTKVANFTFTTLLRKK